MYASFSRNTTHMFGEGPKCCQEWTSDRRHAPADKGSALPFGHASSHSPPPLIIPPILLCLLPSMDDDVQYLGTRLAPTEPLDDPCDGHRTVAGRSFRHPPLAPSSHLSAGITLHVEKCGDRPAHDLTFYRARSAYVNVGRKSGSDDRSMRRENDDHNAVFTCQVVSAKHAKLVLSDSGQVAPSIDHLLCER